MTAAIQKLLETIDEIVNDTSMPYRDKLELVRSLAADHGQTNLEEFLSWFDVDDEEEEE